MPRLEADAIAEACEPVVGLFEEELRAPCALEGFSLEPVAPAPLRPPEDEAIGGDVYDFNGTQEATALR
jgi:hypothetical protein